jgi:hypothetical protein
MSDLGFYLDEQYEQVLQDNDVAVEDCDAVTDGHGNESPHPFGHSWMLVWKHGFIDLGSFDDEIVARKSAAIFVYLYLKEVPVEFCVERAHDFAYMEFLKVKLQETRDELDAVRRNAWLTRDVKQEGGC